MSREPKFLHKSRHLIILGHYGVTGASVAGQFGFKVSHGDSKVRIIG